MRSPVTPESARRLQRTLGSTVVTYPPEHGEAKPRPCNERDDQEPYRVHPPRLIRVPEGITVIAQLGADRVDEGYYLEEEQHHGNTEKAESDQAAHNRGDNFEPDYKVAANLPSFDLWCYLTPQLSRERMCIYARVLSLRNT